MSYTTPWSQALDPGTYRVTLVDTTITNSEGTWNFTGWQDGVSGAERDVTLSAGQTVSLMATYQLQGGKVTPYVATLPKGTHTVAMPATIQSGGVAYAFKQWEDGSTNPTRTFNLQSDITLTATYQATSPTPNLLPLLVTVGIISVAGIVYMGVKK